LVSCGSPTQYGPSQTWSWGSDNIAGLPGGLRAATFDRSRDCLWILTRYFQQAGVPLVLLSRFNIADGSSTASVVQLAGQGYIRGSLQVDSSGMVWMTWGRSLFSFNPTNGSTTTWPLPDLTSIPSNPVDPGLDGNAVALAIDSSNEVWVAANSVEGLAGFSPAQARWNHLLSLPVAATQFTRIDATESNVLIVNGVRPGGSQAMASVNTTSNQISVWSADARTYVRAGNNEAVFEDSHGDIGKVDLSNGQTSALSTRIPVAGDPALASNGSGGVWFSMSQYRSVGVGRLDVASATAALYPLPQAVTASSGGPVLTCPAVPCNNAGAVFDPQIQSIVIDGRANVWVMTGVPGTGGDESFTTPDAPIYELMGT
jgi:hypothetical protein